MSYADQADKLFRRLSFQSRVKLIPIDVENAIDGDEEMELVNNWIKSPHLNRGVVNQLKEVSEEEIDYVSKRAEELTRAHDELRETLERIDQAERVVDTKRRISWHPLHTR